MKHVILGLASIFLAPAGFAQSTEFSLHFTSGLGAFRGPGAATETGIMVPDDGLDDYVYLFTTRTVPYAFGPYGRKAAVTYGGAAQVQRVARGKVVFGMQAGYEVLRSRTRVFVVFDQSDAGTNVTGKAIISSQAVNLHSFAGHRFSRKQLTLDVTAGPELAVLLRSQEKSRAETDRGTVYTTKVDREHPTYDVRARLNVTVYRQRAGIACGYSYGLTDYRYSVTEIDNTLRYHALRLGLTYRLGSFRAARSN